MGGKQDNTLHFKAKLGQTYQQTPSSGLPQQRGSSAEMLDTGSHILPEVRPEGPMARVYVEDERIAGYCCNPAVADSSMHIGILAGTPDGKMRIPSKACQTHFSTNSPFPQA